MLNKYFLAASAVVVLVGLGLGGAWDAEERGAQHRLYCEMTALWAAEAAAGVPEAERAGWPAFNGTGGCP
jgi:hypothetical protein